MTCCFTLVFPVVSDLQSPALNHFLTSKIYLISLPNFQLPLLIYNKRTYISCINQIWLKFFLLQFLHLCRELSICVFLKILFIFFFIFRERRREGEREDEKQQYVVASCTPATGDLAYNPSMKPDWQSNLQPFASQAHAQSIDLYQPWLNIFVLIIAKTSVAFLTHTKYYPLTLMSLNILFFHLKTLSFYANDHLHFSW